MCTPAHIVGEHNPAPLANAFPPPAETPFPCALFKPLSVHTRKEPMRVIKRSLTVAAILVSAIVATAIPASAIIGGQDATQSYPGAVSLTIDLPGLGTAICAGGLVRPSWVLTAAHCVSDPIVAPTPAPVPAGGIRVRAGTNQRTSGGVLAVGDAVLLYPDWQWGLPGLPVSDVALIRLEMPILNMPLMPVAWSVDGDPLREIGWGLTAFPPVRPVVLPETLQQRDTTRLPIGECGPGFPGLGDLCSGPAACFGDSGGPALRPLAGGKWTSVGIASREATEDGSCGKTVYTDVTYPPFRLWIWFSTSIPFGRHVTTSTYTPGLVAPAKPNIHWLPTLI
jgi:Trypsin